MRQIEDCILQQCWCCIFLIFSAITGGAEHQTTVFHIPLADLVAISGVPPARCYPYLGLPVFWPGQISLPHPGLLCYANVSFSNYEFWFCKSVDISFNMNDVFFLTFLRLIRDNLLAGDFTVNMRLLQVRVSVSGHINIVHQLLFPKWTHLSDFDLSLWLLVGLPHLRRPHHPDQGQRDAR